MKGIPIQFFNINTRSSYMNQDWQVPFNEDGFR